MLLNIAGFLCLVVGLFFTVWTSYIAMARVYDRLENDLLPPA
jgi:ABC-type siderophore export system fused ATPase/permease subunit